MCKCNCCGEPLHREIEDRTLRVYDNTGCLEEWLFGRSKYQDPIGLDCAAHKIDGEWYCPLLETGSVTGTAQKMSRGGEGI